MAQYKNYVIAQTLDEAYALNAKKSTVIVAGKHGSACAACADRRRLTCLELGLDYGPKRMSRAYLSAQ